MNKDYEAELDNWFRRLEERIEYNRHDMLQLSMFIRVGYVKNFLNDSRETLSALLRRVEVEAYKVGVQKFITNGWGERCKAKDIDDFPELKETDQQGRCACCVMWEHYDEWLQALLPRSPQEGDGDANS